MSDRPVRFAVVAALSLVLVMTWTPIHTRAATNTAAEQSQQIVHDFFAAYDRHDLGATVRFFGGQLHDAYSDCNYATGQGRIFIGNATRDNKPHLKYLKKWLRARFAEHDHFDVTSVYSNPRDPTAVGIDAMRTSDTLVRLGLAPLAIDNDKLKVVGSRLYRVVLAGSGRCP